MSLAEELAKKFEVSIHDIQRPVDAALERAAQECEKLANARCDRHDQGAYCHRTDAIAIRGLKSKP